MSLPDEIAKKQAQENADTARQANPEQEAKLARFAAENPQVWAQYNAMSKEELVRQAMLAEMQKERAEVVVRRNQVLEQWVKENPDILEKVEARLNSVAEAKREREFLAQVQAAKMNQGIRVSKGITP